jgi:hypothetical protein
MPIGNPLGYFKSGMSSGAKALQRNGSVARAVQNRMGAPMQKYGNKMIKQGGMTASAGRALRSAGRTTARYPRRVAGGVGLAAGGMAMNNRRGSQNYPMY